MKVIGYFGSVVFPIWYLLNTSIYFYRQKMHPINARMPLATAFLQLLLISYSVNMGILAILGHEDHCTWTWWHIYIHAGSVCILFSYRIFMLYFAFEVSEARASATSAQALLKNKFLKYYEKLRNGKILMYSFFPILLGLVFPMIIVHILIPTSTWPEYNCWYPPGLAYTGIGLGLDSMFVIWMIGKLNHRVDNFGIRNELVAWIGELFSAIIVWLFIIGFRVGDYWEIGDYISILAIFGANLATIVYPLYLSYASPIKTSEGDSYSKLSEVLAQPVGTESFTQFLVTEFSCENIRCYQDICEFQKLLEEEKLSEETLKTARIRAEYLLEMYFNSGAPSEVNISYQAKKAVTSKCAQFFTLNSESESFEGEIKELIATFTNAKLEIYNLMETDSLPRFRKSTYYRALKHGTPLPSARGLEKITIAHSP